MDTREVQQALRSISFPIAVDGSFGPATMDAVTQFQRGFAPYDLLVDGHAGEQTQQALAWSVAHKGACSDHFRFAEFASKGNGQIKLHRALVRGLEAYRQRYGPTGIIAGYRDPLHNAKVGGAKNSQHLYGNAADLAQVATLNAVRNLGVFSGIGVQRQTGKVRHVDVRHVGPHTTPGTPMNPTIWWYS